MARRKIVDGMTVEELMKLYREDVAPFVAKKSAELSRQYSRYLYPTHTEEALFEPITFKRGCGFNVVFQFVDRGTDYPPSERLICLWYVWFLYRGGIHALRMFIGGPHHIILYLYTPHFIQRFRERCFKDTSVSLPDTILDFICNNPVVLGKEIPSAAYPENKWMIYDDGVCFGQSSTFKDGFEYLLMTFKTFISWDQLSRSRKNVSLEILKEANEKGIDISTLDELVEKLD